jgi:hypothetical protein
LNDISWVKPNPPPNLSCRYFTHATETIIWAAKNAKSRHTFNYKLMKESNAGKQMKSVWSILPPETWEKKFGKHPAQKPLALLERILLAASNEGDMVLDPFLGGGTTVVAALRLSRKVIAVESAASSVDLSLLRICSDLVHAPISVSCLQIAVDLFSRSMDRSNSTELRSMDTPASMKLVRKESSYYFVGASRREVVYAASAEDMTEAIKKFRSSPQSSTEILFVIKTETEIYLAQ